MILPCNGDRKDNEIPAHEGKDAPGRNHNPYGYSMWFAGGGIRPGQTIGRTDDLGFHVVDAPAHVQDVQATILHCLGIDHRRLNFRFRGLNFRLTGVEEHHPVEPLLSG